MPMVGIDWKPPYPKWGALKLLNGHWPDPRFLQLSTRPSKLLHPARLPFRILVLRLLTVTVVPTGLSRNGRAEKSCKGAVRMRKGSKLLAETGSALIERMDHGSRVMGYGNSLHQIKSPHTS